MTNGIGVGSIPLPDRDYSCGIAFCDDPACNTHGPKDSNGNLLYWEKPPADKVCPVCGG